MKHQVEVLAVDWGTTHRRAYALDGQARMVRRVSDSLGAASCKGRFADVLAQTLPGLPAQPQCIVMSGMVGSAMGWHQVPYVDATVGLEQLAEHCFAVPRSESAVPAWIVPGYCLRDAQGQPDVMRGEETQLLGAVVQGYRDGWFVLPGTHSKWVLLTDGRVTQLRTYMTGELFDLLGQHGTIAAAMDGANAVWDDAAFADGVQASASGGLSHRLFGCRARVVSGAMPASATRAYLSGLLIGAELHDVLGTGAAGTGQSAATEPAHKVRFIGSPALATPYQQAAQQLHLTLECLDAEAAYVAAANHIYHHLPSP
jgi:2-dehydro-3-deoxygalactonokinase